MESRHLRPQQFFREFPTTPTSVQKGVERFPRRSRGVHPPPRLETWRCNLTALSHIHNLYFVASHNSVLVYEPNFPDQKIAAQPSLVLHPTGAAPDAEVLHPQGEGRIINYVLVDFLGNDEILLLALHDGRVIGYHVDAIQRAIDKRQEPDNVETIAGDDVRPFFTESAGKSAWGLAIHQEARLIAVSCNAHTVTVFAPALTKDSLPNPRSWLTDRTRQYRIVTPDSGENIPCVAFCNTGDDPDGRWVLTSDINGYTRIIDLLDCLKHEPACVDMHAHRFCAPIERSGRKECACHFLEVGGARYYLHATWGVMWLDRRAFKRTDDLNEALGSEGPPKVEKLTSTVDCYDNSDNRQRVRNSALVYDPASDHVSWIECEEHTLTAVESPAIPGNHEYAEPLNELPVTRGIRIRRAPLDPGGVVNLQTKIPASPIMRMSVRDIFLLQPRSTKPPQRSPIGFFDPFFQHINDDPLLEQVCTHDRINLHAQIVELGLAIVGSAKGRVAIMSLTQTAEEGHSNRRPLYGCRIDWILPFRDQERAGNRPMAPLVGLAVGPVQGMLGRRADCSRRWRLIMMYADNSILSYELGKSREGRVTVHEFGGLVV